MDLRRFMQGKYLIDVKQHGIEIQHWIYKQNVYDLHIKVIIVKIAQLLLRKGS